MTRGTWNETGARSKSSTTSSFLPGVSHNEGDPPQLGQSELQEILRVTLLVAQIRISERGSNLSLDDLHEQFWSSCGS